MSATYSPWRCIAVAIARACVDQLAGITKLLFKRNSEPNGMLPLLLPARCRAGHTWVLASTASRKVTRSACGISPDAASLARTSSGAIGRPAASPEVQPSGRIALEVSSHAAVEYALHWPPADL